MQPHNQTSEQQGDFAPPGTPHILVVDDEPDIRNLLQEILEDEGFDVDTAENAASARQAYQQRQPDLVLLDIWMPDVDGITLLKEWVEQSGLPMPVIMMSGHGTVETAVEATRLGAFDFIEKPLSLAKLLHTVEQALQQEQFHLTTPRALPENVFLVSEPLGRSAVMQKLREQLKRLAEHNSPVLINGEPGSGIQVAANYIHNHSHRSSQPFIEVNLATLQQDTSVAELCGKVVNGQLNSGLLSRAAQGTLFLKDIQQASSMLQSLLASVLQEQHFVPLNSDKPESFTARVICSSTQDLQQLVEQGIFDRELFYLINVVPITIPPLREHREDIPELINYYTNLYVDHEKLPYRRFSLAAQNRLRNYSWPGNIRELMNLVQRLLINGSSSEISIDEVEAVLEEPAFKPAQGNMSAVFELPLREAREHFEREYLLYRLQQAEGSVGKVAKEIGLERTHLYRKLRSLGIDPKTGHLEQSS